jgi:hypothetical protein
MPRGRRCVCGIGAANRVDSELTVGAIPEGAIVRQCCGSRLCVRPDHLFLATGLLARSSHAAAA